MKLEEMRGLDQKQLEDKISDWRKELLKERVVANRNKKASKPHIFPKLKKQIARAYTLINQKLAQG
jgi:ribosomal protein L29